MMERARSKGSLLSAQVGAGFNADGIEHGASTKAQA